MAICVTQIQERGLGTDQSTRTYEAMDLWLDYLGPNYASQGAGRSIAPTTDRIPTKPRTKMKEFEVIRIERDGRAL